MLGNILVISRVLTYAWLKVFSMVCIVGRATVLVEKLIDLKSTVALYKVFESFCFVFVCFRMCLSALVCLTAPGAFERFTRVILAQNSSAPWSLCLKSHASIYLLILSTQFCGNILFLGVCLQRTPGLETMSTSTSKPVKHPKSNLDFAKVDLYGSKAFFKCEAVYGCRWSNSI